MNRPIIQHYFTKLFSLSVGKNKSQKEMADLILIMPGTALLCSTMLICDHYFFIKYLIIDNHF
jgi:hypothetical protein